MFFDVETGSGAIASVNEQLTKELHKPVIKKFKGRRVYARFQGNIWAADLAEIESLSKNRSVKYRSLFVIDVFTKYICVKHLKDKKDKKFLNTFIKKVNESNCNPNKLRVDKGR